MDQNLCDRSVRGKTLSEHLEEAFGFHSDLRSLEFEQIAIDDGFVSNIFRLKFRWNSSNGTLPASAIVKFPSVDGISRVFEPHAGGNAEEIEKMKAKLIETVKRKHRAECNFYTIFKKSTPIAMPKCYIALPDEGNDPGMIVLEDLSEQAAVVPSRIDGLTYPQLISAVKELARLQAFSLTTSIDWRSKIPSITAAMDLSEAMVLKGLQQTKEQYLEHFGDIDVERLSAMLSLESYRSTMEEHRKFIDDVLVHGDYHSNNIMFAKSEHGTLSDSVRAVVDFQAAQSASPAYDIAFLLSLSVPTELRRTNYERIILTYYNEAKSLAGDKFSATYEQMKSLINRQFAVLTVSWIAYFPTVLLVLVKSHGAEKTRDINRLLKYFRDNLDDALTILGL